MEDSFQGVLIDALTQALEKKFAVTIKNNINQSIIVITATDSDIIVSLSKVPFLADDVIHIISDALGKSPDMIYNRTSMIKEDFIIHYMVWLLNDEKGKNFVRNEFSLAQNNITFLSNRALNLIKGMQ
jgi:tRNA G37 N-methylase Trm5